MQQRMPEENDILEGVISRIEPYGAFCRLSGYGRLQGLIHISQLAVQKVEKVEDVISLDDHVWIKVLHVEMDGNSQRWRIKLSMKDVAQDGSGRDLGQERDLQVEITRRIESTLNSSIGMGVAIDPMAGRLKIKHDASSQKTFFGGYTLVGDDEGEPEIPSLSAAATLVPLPPLGRAGGLHYRRG